MIFIGGGKFPHFDEARSAMRNIYEHSPPVCNRTRAVILRDYCRTLKPILALIEGGKTRLIVLIVTLYRNNIELVGDLFIN